MKNMLFYMHKLLFVKVIDATYKTLIVFLLFNALNSQAQSYGAYGWYADSVKVDTLKCYSFITLQVVVPYNPEWEMYDFISIRLSKYNSKMGDVKMIPIKTVKNYIKGNNFVYTLYRDNDIENEDASVFLNGSNTEIGTPLLVNGSPSENHYYRWALKYDMIYTGKPKPRPDMDLSADLYGITQTGVKEEYVSSCNCIKKTPQYKSSKLTKTYTIVCAGRSERKGKDKIEPSEFKVLCTHSGPKVNISEIGK